MTDRTPADVLVCVHNSPDDVKKCLESALATLGPHDRLIIVDDGSEDETMRICEHIAATGGDKTHLLRRPQGSGFCKAANAGFLETKADLVIVLNSDTIVTGDWIARITACMESSPDIGLVGPLSNAGGWQTIPELAVGDVPNVAIKDDPETLAAILKLCEGFHPRFDYPIVEQINGFCMAVSRAVLDEIGTFDEGNFPMGYGEENDLTFRAMDAGFLCAVAVDCFVYHAKTKSYTTELRKQYSAAGQKALHSLHGRDRVKNAVSSMQAHPTLGALRREARPIFEENGWLVVEET